MSHLSDEAILLLRDGLDGAADEEAVTHLGACPECRTALEEARARLRSVRAALESTDRDWDVGAARAAVRARLGARAEAASAGDAGQERGSEAEVTPLPRRSGPPVGWSLGRAAAVLLLLAAGASALPWSPVRDWLGGGAAPTPSPEAAVEALRTPGPDARAGIRIDAGAGPLVVEITGVGAGTELTVRWVPGNEVAVFAATGSRFGSSRGRVEVGVAGGPVEVELPRGLAPASIRVDGRMILRNGDAGLELSGPVAERREDRVVFRFPESG